MEASAQFHALAALSQRKSYCTYWIAGWVGPSADRNDVEKEKFLSLQGLEPQPLGRDARSQSLYLLCYPRATD
jgi:hypothetical protein